VDSALPAGCTVSDVDPDFDGVCNYSVEKSRFCSGIPDNCPLVKNPEQTVTVPGSILGDACNIDGCNAVCRTGCDPVAVHLPGVPRDSPAVCTTPANRDSSQYPPEDAKTSTRGVPASATKKPSGLAKQGERPSLLLTPREILEELYTATGGGSAWTLWEGFLGTDPCLDSWPNVICSEGAVISLNLGKAGLSGTIPASLGALASLGQLYLDRNALTGTIPDSIGFIPSLVYLDLHNNSLVGTIPAALGSSSHLTMLDLSLLPHLTGTLPASLAQLPMLYMSFAGDSGLTGPVPDQFGAHVNDCFPPPGVSAPDCRASWT